MAKTGFSSIQLLALLVTVSAHMLMEETQASDAIMEVEVEVNTHADTGNCTDANADADNAPAPLIKWNSRETYRGYFTRECISGFILNETECERANLDFLQSMCCSRQAALPEGVLDYLVFWVPEYNESDPRCQENRNRCRKQKPDDPQYLRENKLSCEILDNKTMQCHNVGGTLKYSDTAPDWDSQFHGRVSFHGGWCLGNDILPEIECENYNTEEKTHFSYSKIYGSCCSNPGPTPTSTTTGHFWCKVLYQDESCDGIGKFQFGAICCQKTQTRESCLKRPTCASRIE